MAQISSHDVTPRPSQAFLSYPKSLMLTLASTLDAANNEGCTVDADGVPIVP